MYQSQFETVARVLRRDLPHSPPHSPPPPPPSISLLPILPIPLSSTLNSSTTLTEAPSSSSLQKPIDFHQDCALFIRSALRYSTLSPTPSSSTLYRIVHNEQLSQAHPNTEPLELMRNLWQLYDDRPYWQMRLVNYGQDPNTLMGVSIRHIYHTWTDLSSNPSLVLVGYSFT